MPLPKTKRFRHVGGYFRKDRSRVRRFRCPTCKSTFGKQAFAFSYYLKRPELAAQLRERAGALYTLLVNKYYFDAFNEKVIAGAARGIAQAFWRGGDVALIDGAAVNGSARLVGWAAGRLRAMQSGYLYHYAFATIIGLSALLGWLLWRR